MPLFFKKTLLIAIVLSVAIPPQLAQAVSPSPSQYLIEIGQKYYDQGCYQEALHEFSKALIADPKNADAQYYINKIKAEKGGIFSREDLVSRSLDDFESATLENTRGLSREEIIRRQLEAMSGKETAPGPVPRENEPGEGPYPSEEYGSDISKYISVKGEYQVAGAVRSPDELIWKEANGDLNEKNYRILYSETRHNTFDPAIFDRFRLNLGTKQPFEIGGGGSLGGYADITIDPWSFVGKSDKFTVAGVGGDSAEFELKYWSNTGKTINEIVYTLTNGDAVALPEIKVIEDRTTPTSATSTFNNTFIIPSQKIKREFLPLRELWLDYNVDDSLKLRFFPIAYQEQALTSDDPLMLSNRHTWWEESPWLAEWQPGNLNTGATPDDFAKGYWDDSLAFFTRDSDGVRLTSLRGFSLVYEGIDTALSSTLASPKNLWEDYGNFKTYATATRFKQELGYNLGMGLTHTGHLGYKNCELDGLNNVFSVDGKFEPVIGTKLTAQAAASESTFDRTDAVFQSKEKGWAYYFSMVNRWPSQELIAADYGSLKRGPDESWYLKSNFRLARLDDEFDPSLADFRQTRDDEFWSRHITFRKHPLYIYTGLTKPMRFDDIKPFAIGDGIDSGRTVIGWRLEGEKQLLDRYLKSLFDVRNVHNVQTGAFIENVARIEMEYPMTDKLMTRFLGIRHNLHKTAVGVDPFIFDPQLNKYYINTAVVGGEDPSLGTVSAGFDYRMNDYFSYNAVYEHTNDSTVAADNYPRGLFNSASFTTVTENGNIYRERIPFLYSQQYFDMPPYEYFDIYKFGFSIRPTHQLEFYLDFAYNENKKAGQIDDNMNHYGLEVAYVPVEKLSFLFKYVQSRWLDMLYLNATGIEIYNWHNNFFFETRYQVERYAEFIFMFGVGGASPVGSASYDPFGGALAVLDTQHIFRLYYKKSF